MGAFRISALRYSRVAASASAFMVVAVLVLVFLHGKATSIDGGFTTETGGRLAAMALLLSVAATAFVTRIHFTVPSWVSYLSGLLSFGLLLALWLLVITGRDSSAWAVYGGLQVLRARVTFADLDWVARALGCGGCEQWPQLHGPALEGIYFATGGVFGPEWVAPLGLLLAAAVSISLVYISQIASGAGKVLLLVAAVSPAWLLLLDRANLDGVVLLFLVIGVWVACRYNNLKAWSALAFLIFVAGAVKYYPFVAGLVLLPVLLVRRGWLVLVGFGGISLAYMAAFWTDFRAASAYNTDKNAVLWDFPAYGRLIVLDRMGAFESGTADWLLSNGLLLGMSASVLIWGWTIPLARTREILTVPTLAIAGSTVFLSAVAVSGFGYMYKGAFLVLLVPLLSLGVVTTQKIGSRFGLFTFLFMLVMIALALTVAYSSLLASIAAWISASFALGVGLRQIVDALRFRGSASETVNVERAH